MVPILLSLATFVSTMSGGLTGLKNQDRLHRILGYTAGVLLGVVAFDLLPEIFKILTQQHRNPTGAMIALVCGFLVFHIVEKSILIHHTQEAEYEVHHHPQVGVASALALSGHSFLDGVGIGLGFQAGTTVGIAVAIAVIAHDFTDGLNTVNLMLLNKNRSRRAFLFLLLDASTPILGVLSTLLFKVSDTGLTLYLGFFAGFLLYIGASEILPEAHSKHSSYKTIGLTIAGVVFMFVVTRFA
ncbi:MAG TPA: ZIP family metal transporter [Verrucomicrobiae bacterium]|jgi:zinc transporter ZupT|nr:ZIP family metal transporter [Verrucomicrobiae bacterium]